MGTPVLECGCKSQIVLKPRKDKSGFMMGCRAYPTCTTTIWLPSTIKNATVTDEYCTKVNEKTKLFPFFFFLKYKYSKQISE